jgi:hypothetical protein
MCEFKDKISRDLPRSALNFAYFQGMHKKLDAIFCHRVLLPKLIVAKIIHVITDFFEFYDENRNNLLSNYAIVGFKNYYLHKILAGLVKLCRFFRDIFCKKL